MKTPIEYQSADGSLRLYAEDSGRPQGPLTVLCLHGLTRNGKDFGGIAAHLSTRHRIITADQRGRGKSQWDPTPKNYQPAVYARDMFKLLDQLQIERVVLLGTSMGGIVSMIMAAEQPARIRGIVLNDIGPEVPNSGLQRLRDSLNMRGPISSWADAAIRARAINGLAFPDYEAADWDAFARRTYGEDASGRPVPGYDPAILHGLNTADLSAVPPDLWTLWTQLAGIPMLAIRGLLSDILSADVLAKMAASHPNIATVGIVNRGHAPMLNEAAAMAAIDKFLDGLT